MGSALVRFGVRQHAWPNQFPACSFNHSDISCAHELHAFGGEPSGPQPHPSFIEVFDLAAFGGGERAVEGTGEDRKELNHGLKRRRRGRQFLKPHLHMTPPPNCPATDEPFSDWYTTYCRQIGVVTLAVNENRTNRRINLKAAKAGRCAAYSSTSRTGEPRGGATRQTVP